jgi:DNA polymerase-4
LEPGGLDEAYLDITGCDIFGTPHQTAIKLKERVKNELHIIASIGISSCKVVSKIASDLSKPDGLIKVTPGEEKHFLAPLPIARLPGVGAKTEQKLRSLGISTIGQLAALPATVVKNYLGTFGIALHRYANGIDDRKVEASGEAKSISRETTFAKDTLDNRFLRAVLRRLSENIGADLRSQRKQARTISVKIRFEDFETLNRSHSLPEPVNLDNAIFKTADELLYRTLSGKKKLVRLLGVEVSNLVGESTQLSMFDAKLQREEKLDKVIDVIRKKYGFDAVQTGRTISFKDIFKR